MKKIKPIIILLLIVLTLIVTACGDEAESASSTMDRNKAVVTLPRENSDNSREDKTAQSDKAIESDIIIDEEHEEPTIELVTKIEGRKTEFLDRLDKIQEELDALPEKEDADRGLTNAMKSYYGFAYEKYDEELNKIYALLKDQLSEEIMRDLQTKQLQWIEDKETFAEEARLEYEGGTFENVAWYMSLYESTKEKCYELVNEYMTE